MVNHLYTMFTLREVHCFDDDNDDNECPFDKWKNNPFTCTLFHFEPDRANSLEDLRVSKSILDKRILIERIKPFR